MAESTAPPPPEPPKQAGPQPPTAGVGPDSRLARFRASRPYRAASGAWRWKGAILTGTAITYAVVSYAAERARAKKRDAIPEKAYLYWKIYDGGIVEAKSYGSNLNYLLSSSQGGSPEEPPRVMTLFDVVRTIKFIEGDDRIRGIIADFSSTSVPSVPSYSLGLAQLEEIQDAMLELKRVKTEKFGSEGKDAWRTVAWSDTFSSQGQYLLASTFDEIYTQPTGEVPLVGFGSTTPFYGRLAKWLGIEVHAEARNEYKSFVQPYIDEKLTEPQRENHRELISELNDNLMTYIGRNRFSTSHPDTGAALEHVKGLSQVGPFTADRATSNGLLNGTCYRQDILDSVLDPEFGGDEDKKLMGFFHYAKVVEKAMEKYLKEAIDVGVVYLMGAIGDVGEFGTAAVVRGLKEAGEDETIGAVVLRIDSGGGGVVDSDTIWGAVRDLRERKGKTVVASFGNASASGGYLVSTHTDAIFAAPSTITGSIGVASLRPTFLQSFFDRFHITLESYFTGSRSQDVTHRLEGDDLARHAAAVDHMYDDFKGRVCEGRGISPDKIEGIAGGRVMTGLKAFGLTAPKELIRQIRGLDPIEGDKQERKVEVVKENTTVTVENSSIEKPEDDLASANTEKSVELAQDQETSPFAPTEPTTSTPSESATAIDETVTGPVTPEAHAEDALRTSTPDEQVPNSELKKTVKKAREGANNGVSGHFEVELGPYGRGLVDGLGGLRDAAVYACQLFIANGVAGYKEENPDISDHEAIKALIPDAQFAQGSDGELALAVDVRLKRFPVQKSFWQSLSEASRRGDSMGDSVSMAILPSFSSIQQELSRWFFTMMADRVVERFDDELNGLGVNTGRRSSASAFTPGLARSNLSSRFGGVRWEMGSPR
ncbi:uncharacterized protein JCM15063_006554 [Sporobolomyces koalae]|uniref:uncharacterized protein n=1 Tax=Sporobolomyces koalae TaxID=500713 RepID=UPI00317F9557